MRLPKYLRSEWAKEAQDSRDQDKELDFLLLTKFLLKKAKLASTEYGRLINAKFESEREKSKKLRFSGAFYNAVSGFASSGTVRENQEVEDKKTRIFWEEIEIHFL